MLTIADLTLCGTDETFPLEADETVVWIKDNGDGTALVRIQFADGGSDVIDADVKPERMT